MMQSLSMSNHVKLSNPYDQGTWMLNNNDDDNDPKMSRILYFLLYNYLYEEFNYFIGKYISGHQCWSSIVTEKVWLWMQATKKWRFFQRISGVKLLNSVGINWRSKRFFRLSQYFSALRSQGFGTTDMIRMM